MILNDFQTTPKFLWCDSWWFTNHSESSLGQFSVIHKKLLNFFGVILSDSWTSLKFLWSDSWWFPNHWFKFLWGGSQWLSVFTNHSKISFGWFSVIWKPLWNFFGAILGDSQQLSVIHNKLKFVRGDSQWSANDWNFIGVILSDFQITLKFLWGWFLVIHRPLWNFFGVILQWFMQDHSEISLGFFSVIVTDSQTTLKFLWGDSQQFSVIHEELWNFFGAILNDSQWWFLIHSEITLGQFSVILGDSQTTLKWLWGNSWWFSVICKPLWNFFGAILGDLGTTLKLIWGDSLQFMNNKFLWGDSWWFSVICKPYWNFFGATLGDCQWFTNHSEISLGWFLVIYKPLWNFFRAILSDLQTTLKFLWGDSWQFSVICEQLWNLFGVILGGNYQWFSWFTNHSEISLGWYLMILRYSWWFMKNWNFLGGNSQWFMAILGVS